MMSLSQKSKQATYTFMTTMTFCGPIPTFLHSLINLKKDTSKCCQTITTIPSK